MSLCALTIAQAAADIREGRITSAELVRDCLQRIEETDAEVQAWAFIDRDHALRQAEALDMHRQHGRALGPLHGIPIGIKDIFDTGDLPTELGSPLWAGRTPRRDAAAVARLRSAGAVIMGKTVTTEYAYYHPGKTRNPHDTERTPGGSSSGSAAAVAAAMVPGALGSQTNGSVIRPAAFCGVVGFKPTHGLIARTGALLLSRTLDHVGVFARAVEDVALIAEALVGFDEEDPDTRPLARPHLVSVATSEPPLPPRFAFVRSPAWKHVEPVTEEAFPELVAALGEQASEVELGARFDNAIDLHRTIMEVEMAHNLHRDYEQGRSQLSAPLCQLIERGGEYKAVDYARAVAAIGVFNEALDPIFDEFDAILTPAAPGEAPRGLASTGNPVFCTTWTYLGVPAVTLPLLQSPAGLPIGVQLVGRRGNDARLLRTARWLVKTLASTARGRPRRRSGKSRSAAQQERQSVMMMILTTGLIGIALLAMFLGIMVWWVKALPLIIIVVGVICLLLYDFLLELRAASKDAAR